MLQVALFSLFAVLACAAGDEASVKLTKFWISSSFADDGFGGGDPEIELHVDQDGSTKKITFESVNSGNTWYTYNTEIFKIKKGASVKLLVNEEDTFSDDPAGSWATIQADDIDENQELEVTWGSKAKIKIQCTDCATVFAGAAGEACSANSDCSLNVCKNEKCCATSATGCTACDTNGYCSACANGYGLDDNVCTAYTWTSGDYSKCSVACGGGTRTRDATCKLGSTTVSLSLCDVSTKPSTTQSCNSNACDCGCNGESITGNGGSCDDWGSDGVWCYTNAGKCPDEKDGLLSKKWSNSACTASIAWSTGSYGNCDETCGGGKKTRPVTCKAGSNSVASSFCDSGSKPDTQEDCNTQSCPYTWSIESSFGSCSAVCGGGTKTRSVVCKAGSATVASSLCDASTKPDSSETCNTSACNCQCNGETNLAGDGGICNEWDSDGVWCYVNSGKCNDQKSGTGGLWSNSACSASIAWSTGSYGNCDETCGGGKKTRPVTCKVGSNSVASSFCDSGSKPDTQEDCNTQSCPYTWSVGSYGSCSVACGTGTKSRSVTCKQGSLTVATSLCDSSTKPSATGSCNTNACDCKCNGDTNLLTGFGATCNDWDTDGVWCYTDSGKCPDQTSGAGGIWSNAACSSSIAWSAGSYGSCSKTCGGGTKTRSITCKSGSNSLLSSFCDQSSKPSAVAACNTQECGKKDTGSCSADSECSSGSCKAGSCCTAKGLTTGCIDCHPGDGECDACASGYTLSSYACIPTPKTWSVGSYGSCSAAVCGTGSKTRTVSCKQGSVTIASSECDASTKPSAASSCSIRACDCKCNGNSFLFDGGTCDDYDSDGVWCYVDINKCPDQTSGAGGIWSNAACSSSIAWSAGSYGSCSKTCGGGTKTRSITCKSGSNSLLSSFCDQSSKPSAVAACNTQECPKKDTGSCSADSECSSGSCKAGSCCTAKGLTTGCIDCHPGDGECDACASGYALSSYACIPDVPTWSPGSFGSCSVACGTGVKTRPVTCEKPLGGTTVDSSLCDANPKPSTTGSCNTNECNCKCNGNTNVLGNGGTCDDWDSDGVWCYSNPGDCPDQDVGYGGQTWSNSACSSSIDWSVSSYGLCSETCNGGQQTRSVRCKVDGLATVANSFCNQSTIPTSTRTCNTQPCDTGACTSNSMCSSGSCKKGYCCTTKGMTDGCVECHRNDGECEDCSSNFVLSNTWECRVKTGGTCSSESQCDSQPCLGGKCCSGNTTHCSGCDGSGSCSSCTSPFELRGGTCEKPPPPPPPPAEDSDSGVNLPSVDMGAIGGSSGAGAALFIFAALLYLRKRRNDKNKQKVVQVVQGVTVEPSNAARPSGTAVAPQ